MPWLLAITLLAGALALAAAPPRRSFVYVLEVAGIIDPPTAAYIARGIEAGEKNKAQAIIIRLNTPGGLDLSMRQIIQAMLASTVPVVVYVSPEGARAASAGAIITLAANVAAMAPSTSIGAAHPWSMGGGQMSKEMSEKVANDAAAFARGLAKTRGRNQQWAEQVVRKSVANTADEALKLHVIDLIAADMADLLRKIDGREVKVAGRVVTLHAANAAVEELPASVAERFLHLLSDPNLAYIFLIIGIYGIIFELQSPGAILPGVVGAICLIMGFYSMSVLSVNLAGLALLIIGVAMLIVDIWAPSHGALTVGGAIAFAVGSLMLYGNRSSPALRVSWQVVVIMTVLTAAFFLFVVGLGARAHWTRIATGAEGLMGARGAARSALSPAGQVFVDGALWRARAMGDETIEAGADIEVVGIDGLTLRVRRAGTGSKPVPVP
jgi:membrane-bound serine protease (ClpP class)